MSYYAIVAAVIGAVLLAYDWYRSALAKQSAADAQALAGCKFGRKFSSPAMGAAYDQSKVAQWQRRENAKAGHARRKSRLAQDRVKPATVPTPFRKVK